MLLVVIGQPLLTPKVPAGDRRTAQRRNAFLAPRRRARGWPRAKAHPLVRGRRRAAKIPPLLHDRTFRLFWLGQSVSMLGDQISLLALPLVAVLVLDAGPAQMGYLTAAGVAPSLLFSLHVGVRVDRRGRRRRTMLVADVIRAALLLTIPTAYALDSLTMAQLYAVIFCVGTLDVFFFVAYSTLFVSVVRRDQYVEGQALLNGSRAFSFVGGQGAAGLLVAALTAPVAVVADALTFLVSALFLSRIDPPEPPTAPEDQGQLLVGARFIAGSGVVRAALAATATANFFNYVYAAVFVLFATRTLGLPPEVLGLSLGFGAVGGLVGAALAGRIGRRIGIGPEFVLGCLLFSAPLALLPAAGGARALVVALVVAAEFGVGFGVILLDISVGAIFAAVIPDELRGRVSGAYRAVNYGIRPLGALTGGFLGSAIGLRATLWVAVVGGCAAVLWLVASPVVRLRVLPDGAPAAEGAVGAAD
ncbi:MAG TPA: MFS transporter [Mycobacteriales bacterium]|nr:MFS transporter [Mycobacteriales bacterium]